MEEVIFTSLGRNPDPSPVGREGFAGVTWKQDGTKYTVWLVVPPGQVWLTFLPRVFEWATQTSEDLRRKDRENFFANYFRSTSEIMISGLPLKRKYSEQSPLDDISTETLGEPTETEASPSAPDAAGGD